MGYTLPRVQERQAYLERFTTEIEKSALNPRRVVSHVTTMRVRESLVEFGLISEEMDKAPRS